MNVKRALSLGLGGGAVAAWLAAAATSGSRPIALQPSAPAPAIDPSASQLKSEISRLRERLRPTTPPVQSRDLFQYASRGSSNATTVPRETAIREPAPAPEESRLKLIGIAEDGAGGALVRTAILSGLGDLVLAKEGEAVGSRYRVSRITSDSVELTDSSDLTTLRLGLP
jgi:hypothetical protein